VPETLGAAMVQVEQLAWVATEAPSNDGINPEGGITSNSHIRIVDPELPERMTVNEELLTVPFTLYAMSSFGRPRLALF